MQKRVVLGRGLALCGALGLGARAGQAQTLKEPQAYMWGSHIPSGFNYTADPHIKPAVHVNTAYNLQYTPTSQPFNPDSVADDQGTGETGAFMAGRWAAKRVLQLGLAAGHVSITIQNYGRDEAGCDAPYGGTEPDFNCNVFRSVDRIRPVGEEWIENDPPGSGFPTWRGAPPPLDDLRTARFYRHPFLTNAGGNPNNLASTPMRTWMEQFLDGYKAEQATNPAIPRPDRFHFDSEPLLYPNANANWLYVLQKIAEDNTIWTTWPVPGYNQTLKQLYDLHIDGGAEDWDWPADGAGQPFGRGILNLTTGMAQGAVATNPRNFT